MTIYYNGTEDQDTITVGSSIAGEVSTNGGSDRLLLTSSQTADVTVTGSEAGETMVFDPGYTISITSSQFGDTLSFANGDADINIYGKESMNFEMPYEKTYSYEELFSFVQDQGGEYEVPENAVVSKILHRELRYTKYIEIAQII